MGKEIEKLIKENRDFFDDANPMEGHFERFEARLDHEFKVKRKLNARIIWQIAASVAIIVLVVNQVWMYTSPKETEIQTLGTVSPEYKEAEFYYTNAINNGLTQWNELKSDGTLAPDQDKMLNQEMAEFDKTYQSLQNELNANPNDERVINAMIELYQTKLNLISMLLDKMKEVKQLKKQSHGTEI